MISLNWVKDYIDLDGIDLKDLAVKVTKAGINVEKVISKHIENLVVGKVIECVNHPNSDHLHVCKVDIGTDVLQIVCGAPNVKENIKVIVSLIGAVLPGNFEIKKSVIRGIESSGMICSLSEIGLEENTPENYAKGIYILPDELEIGSDPLSYFGSDDIIYDLDVHKHRNNDCYYHIGFAYEIASILNKKVKLPETNYKEIEDNINNHFSLKVDTDKCSYYLAKMVTGIKICESPKFIQNRLISAGMRPINNVVDISNYVMLEYGQPLHFFDKDKLGDKIIVRNATKLEKIITLDNKERNLTENDIIITDGQKPVCIAGIMGGLNTDVDENTNSLLIESAIFNSVSIRNTASRLDLKSEASIRYGKGLNYEYTKDAINRACHLLEKYADAKVLSGIVVYDKIEKKEKIVSFYPEEVNKILGIKISKEDMAKELERLMFNYKFNDDKFIVTIPNRRLDIDPFVNDIAEEIGRLYGYENLISTLPKGTYKKGEYIGDVKYRKIISKRLRSLGLNECKTYTLVSLSMANLFKYENKENVVLPNPMSADKSIVRTTIIPSLLNVYDYNKARKVDDILLYEISKTYDKDFNEDIKVAMLISGKYIYNAWNHNEIECDFYTLKGIVQNLLDYLGLKNRYNFVASEINNLHPGISASITLDNKQIGIIGKVHPTICKDNVYVCELSINKLMGDIKPIKYKEASKYPEIIKDVAFVCNKDITCDSLMKEIKKAGGRLLKNIDVFDLYIPNNDSNEKSIAFKLTYSDNERTLTEKEVMDNFENIINKVTNNLNVKLRG